MFRKEWEFDSPWVHDMKTLKVYKIQSKTTGLFSTGGTSPRFSRIGKTWSNIGHLKTHLLQFSTLPEEYSDCEIIELEYKPIEGSRIDIREFHGVSSVKSVLRNMERERSNLRHYIKDLETRNPTYMRELQDRLGVLERKIEDIKSRT